MEFGTGDLTQPLAQRSALGEKASTVTFLPFDLLFFVDNATTITVFFFFARVISTARRMVFGEYWSTMRERFPLTYTATLPFFGPAVNHIANDLPLTVNDNAAPVVEVDHTVPPYATLIEDFFHGAATLTALADDVTSPLATRTAATASVRLEKCMTSPYLP